MNTAQIINIVSLIPERQVIENIRPYRPWYLLWLFAINVKREIIIWYNVSVDNKLIAEFESNKGYKRFPNKEQAERWFGADIEISEYVGETVISETRKATLLIKCTECGLVKTDTPDDSQKSKVMKVSLKGPRSVVKKPIHILLPHSDTCDTCEGYMSYTLIESF